MIGGSVLVRRPDREQSGLVSRGPSELEARGNPPSPVPFIRKRPGTPHRLAAPLMSVPPGKSG